ncbi:MAG: hypothetical protein L0Y56_02270 [Nitrospira sp.]|nr:hypothetical protein [Nitrospira sp.]
MTKRGRRNPIEKKSRGIAERMFREVFRDEPQVVAKTRRKKGAKAAHRQKVAIALSKARRAGARIPKG